MAPRGVLGAAGLALWRFALTLEPLAPTQIALDAAAFAIFAFMRNDATGFWQLPGPWSDVPHFNVAGAAIAYASISAARLPRCSAASRPAPDRGAWPRSRFRSCSISSMTLGADWHMQELGALLSPDVPRSFQGQVFVGRTALLFVVAEALLLGYSVDRDRPAATATQAACADAARRGARAR